MANEVFAEHKVAVSFSIATPARSKAARVLQKTGRGLAESIGEAASVYFTEWARSSGLMVANIEVELMCEWEDADETFRISVG